MKARPLLNFLRTRRRTAVWAALLLAAVSPARADCVDGTRPPSAAELEFAARAQAALAAALPAPIADSERRGAPYDFAQQPRLSFCRGMPEGAFSIGVQGAYLYRFPKAEADRMYAERKRIEQQIEQIEQLPPEREAQRQQLLAQMRAAYDSAPRRARRDPPFTAEQQAAADRANAEGRRLEDAANKVAFDHRASVKPQTEPLRAQAKALETFPQEIAVRLALNLDRFADSGPQTASFGVPSARRSAGLRVHNVALAVTGPEGAARQAFFAAVDRNYLQALIGQAPPELAASQTRAAKSAAAPAVTATPATAQAATAPATAGTPNAAAPKPATANPAAREAVRAEYRRFQSRRCTVRSTTSRSVRRRHSLRQPGRCRGRRRGARRRLGPQRRQFHRRRARHIRQRQERRNQARRLHALTSRAELTR